ncbi:MAG: helicase-related protein, partial [Nitrososphaerales archaeon]
RALTLDLLKQLTGSGWKTLVFSNSHLAAELTAFYGRRNGVPVEVHRAGLLPSLRKSVEERFRSGDLKAISSTPTLELGIDIGTIDAVISDLVTWTRLIQRTGRAGRRGQESIVFLSLRENDPISQYYKNNPEDYFKDIEPGYIDPSNPVVSRFQLLAASIDRPIKEGEFTEYQHILDELVDSDLLSERKGGLAPNYAAARRLLRLYDIRGAGDNVSILLQNRKIGERSMPQALDELHPDAVYFLGGARYRSKNLTYSLGAGRAEVERLPNNYPYYTRPLKEEWPIIDKTYFKKKVMNVEVAYCDLSILRKVIGYTNIEIGAEASKGVKVRLDEPVEYSFRTKGLIFKAPLPSGLLNSISNKEPEFLAASSFHATEHVTIEGTNMITGGAASDMGGVSLGNSGLIFIYDGSQGGNGATRMLYERLGEALKRGFTILNECSCTSEDGCPRCTYSYRCGNNNEYLNRGGATEVLRRILEGEETTVDLEISPEWRPLV